jgi:hypothetical protein
MSVEPYSPDYHLVYGLHSGYPLCCVFYREDNGGGGACPRCQEAGLVPHEIHRCHEDIPACQPYIELVTQGMVDRIEEKADEGWGEICIPNLRFPSTTDRVIAALHLKGYSFDREETYGGIVQGVDDEGPPPKSYYVYRKEGGK